METNKVKTVKITLRGHYDSDKSVEVLAKVGVDGNLYLTRSQFQSAYRRARLMEGDWLVCDTELEQSSIAVYDGNNCYSCVSVAQYA